MPHMNSYRVRLEKPTDALGIRAVNEAAFGQADEADLVDALRAAGEVVVSLVADSRGSVLRGVPPRAPRLRALVGHILFSRLRLQTAGGVRQAAALAPMAVRPDWQRQGVGGNLVRDGLDQCRRAGVDAVVVLGHPDYYPRFGFSPKAAANLRAPYSGPAFMALELTPGALSGGGSVRYPDAFARL